VGKRLGETMRVGDAVRPKRDLMRRGIGVIVSIEPAEIFPNGQMCGARYWVLYASGAREVTTGLALEKV